MKPALRSAAFTLIELLVVIAVIALLASMIFPVTGALHRNKIKTRTKAELSLVTSAIESYKAKLGQYPPDNPSSHLVNQLYYELVGTVYTTNSGLLSYAASDGHIVSFFALTNALKGPGGLANFTPRVDGEEGASVVNFIKQGFSPLQFQTDSAGVRYLVSTIQWPVSMALGNGFVNHYCIWRYNSSNPTNNPGSFDLWVDVLIDGKTNRFSNWKNEPTVVTTPDE